MSYLPMLAMVATARRHRRRAMMDNLWPAMIPTTNVMQRGAIAAVAADSNVRRAERNEAHAARETVAAVERAAKRPDGKLTDADLQSLPALTRVAGLAPDVRTAIDQVVANQNVAFSTRLDNVAEEVARLTSALIKDKPADVTMAQLQELAPSLADRFQKNYIDAGGVFKPIDISLPQRAGAVVVPGNPGGKQARAAGGGP